MADEIDKKQDGRAIFDALAAFEGMPEREQPTEQERDWSAFDAYGEMEADKMHGVELSRE